MFELSCGGASIKFIFRKMLLTALIAVLVIVMYTIYYRVSSSGKAHGRPLPSPSPLKGLFACMYSAVYNNMHDFAEAWAHQFGDIFEIKVFTQRIVFVNDAKLIKKIFGDSHLKELTNDRPPTFIGKYIVYGDKNIAFTNRSFEQRRRRKIFHGVLKFYGENVYRVESIITKALNNMIDEISCQEEIEISKHISRSVLKIVHILLAGEYSECSEGKLDVLQNLDRMWGRLFVFENETILSELPILRFCPGLPFKKKYDDLIEARTELEKFYFHEMRASRQKGKERGIVDHLFAAQENLGANGDFQTLTDDSIKASLIETTVASYVTTNNTTNILILYLMLKPEIQNKIAREIREVIGHDIPSFKHRHLMPYTEAVLLETLRHSSISPFLLPHYARDDVEVNGFRIHKNSIIMMNAWYCHRREDQWPEPWMFSPERFLDVDGNLLPADGPLRQNLIAFGAGSRICPGENFARSRMFLILVTLLQRFEFYPLDHASLPSTDPRDWPNGYTCKVPAQYTCRVRHRDFDKL